ncbi:MAG TPA: transglutaminaseTgpA domain-containing protein [Rubrobacteraceae bacterium]|nr:transglutaminaseTgpA domain-containing protein [Rubrobacteraceae bacterium]
MAGIPARACLYTAALVTGGAFAILFTGETAGGGFGGNSVVALGGAFWAMLGAALAALLVGSAGRYRFVFLFPVAAFYTILAVYGRPPLFSISSWQEFLFTIGTDVYEAAGVMYAEPIPYDLAPGLFVLLIPVVMIVVTFATSATLYEESPIISVSVLGVTIGVLSTISFEDGAGIFFALFLACAVALLLSSGASPGRLGVVAGAVVVALVLALPRMPLSDATISPGLIDWTRIGTGGASRLDVQADVGDYLSAGRDAEIMRVESPEPLLWRGGTLDYFDGVRWSDTTEPGIQDGEEIAPGVPSRSVIQRVRILNAQTNLVFGGYKIINTSLPFATENSDGSWTIDEPLVENGYYTVYSEIPQPTSSQLQGAGTAYPPLVREKFLQLPDDRPAVVAETAEGIMRDYEPATPYEKARAVERYLIYDGGFTYNLDVSYRRADRAIEEFLGEGREGFCTQFATSMALLLRELDVPSRVVYGSTAGEEVEPDEFVVTGSNMHTWVEAYFPGVGWYTFDPTPGFSVPSAMEANAPRPEVPVTRQDVAIGDLARDGRARAEQEEARRTEETPQSEGSAPSGAGLPVWPLLLFAPVLLGVVSLAKRALLARGRPEDLYRDLVSRMRDVLPPGRAGIADSPALTPTERLLLLAGAVGLEEGPVGEFARAYSDHLYAAPPAGGRSSRHLRSAYRRAKRAFERLPLWRRALGAANPSSLLARAKRGASALGARLGKAARARLRFRR